MAILYYGMVFTNLLLSFSFYRYKYFLLFFKSFPGIRIFSATSRQMDHKANGLKYKRDQIDIYSNSWGPLDNGYSVKGPGIEEIKALKYGALKVGVSI